MKKEESGILGEVGESIQCVGRREEKFNVSLVGGVKVMREGELR